MLIVRDRVDRQHMVAARAVVYVVILAVLICLSPGLHYAWQRAGKTVSPGRSDL